MQKERRDSVDVTQETSETELESSLVMEPEKMDTSQTKMIIIFQALQFFHTILTVSLGPIYPLMALYYNVPISTVRLLYLFGLVACLIAFFPTNGIIGRYGIKSGLTFCLLGTLLGGVLCCLINVNFYLFMAGAFIMQFFMQSIHSAKGYFVNLYFEEKHVINFLNFLEGIGLFQNCSDFPYLFDLNDNSISFYG